MVSLMPMTESGDVGMTRGVNQVDMIDALSAGPKNKKAWNLRVNSEVSKAGELCPNILIFEQETGFIIK